MGFQDNSGDIIFDVVLTDEGRRRLSNPSDPFEITKFALGDDEVNYGLFNKLTASAYQDVEILQTPIFEAFTNNTSNMSSYLVTYTNNNLLYLPIVKLNELSSVNKRHASLNNYLVTVNEETAGNTTTSTGVGYDTTNTPIEGFIMGHNIAAGGWIRVDAGIDNSAVPPAEPIDAEYYENSYTLEIDNRLGKICDPTTGVELEMISIDDDDIALYLVDASSPGMFKNNTETDANSLTEAIAGARSSILKFAVTPSVNLKQSNFLFTRLGGTTTMNKQGGGTSSVRYIDTLIKITGQDTGYSIDIPIRFVKLV